jgi:DNA polymerase-3 subunit gamma/tau
MSYLVLARKYRPQTFEELVGQEHVTTTLVNALEAKRIAHAYIFSGPRGCGKTTTARLLAKALNCAKGPTTKPCGTCPQCVEIATGNSPDDVLEIDGASNRGIDQIRELRDTVKYSPSHSRYRIYIIDEAHQITEAGFNALLKTLEEPPAHAVFMMATTDAQKVPATILSRCQRFQLRSIPPAMIQKQLEEILAKEKIKSDAEALAEVSRAAHGSLRDALSLLDQVIAYSPDGFTAKDIRSLLGLLPQERVREFAAVLRDGAPDRVLQAVQKATEDGFDLFQLAHDLLEYWHVLLLLKSGVDTRHLSDRADADKDGGAYGLDDLERNLQIVSRCGEQMRRSESPRVTFELACLELGKKSQSVDDLVDRLESLERSLRAGAGPDLSPLKKNFDVGGASPLFRSTASPAGTSSPFRSTAGASPLSHSTAKAVTVEPPRAPALAEPAASLRTAVSPPVPIIPPRPTPTPAAVAVEPKRDEVSPDQVRGAWLKMLEEVGGRKPSLEPLLTGARWNVKPGNVLEVFCRDEFQRHQIASNLLLVREGLQKHLAGAVTVQCLVETAAPAAPPSAPGSSTDDAEGTEIVESEDGDDVATVDTGGDGPAETATPASAAELLPAELMDLDPGLKKVMDRFPGRIRKIEVPVHG